MWNNLKTNTTLVYICGQPDYLNEGIRVLNYCNKKIKFDNIILFSCINLDSYKLFVDYNIQVVNITELTYPMYNVFLFAGLTPHISTDYCLCIHGDGFIINEDNWDDKFFDYDYIGPPLAYLGNPILGGGFSLRSKKLLQYLHDKFLTLAYDSQPKDKSEDMFISDVANENLIEDAFTAKLLDSKHLGGLHSADNYNEEVSLKFNYCKGDNNRKRDALRFCMDDSEGGGGANPDDYYIDLFGEKSLCKCGSYHHENRTSKEIIDHCFGFHDKVGKLSGVVEEWYMSLELRNILSRISTSDLIQSIGLVKTYIGTVNKHFMDIDLCVSPYSKEKPKIQGPIGISQHPLEYIRFIEDIKQLKNINNCLFINDYNNQICENNLLAIYTQVLALSISNPNISLDIVIENEPKEKTSQKTSSNAQSTMIAKLLCDLGMSVNIIQETDIADYFHNCEINYDYLALSYGNTNSALFSYHLNDCKKLCSANNGYMVVYNLDNMFIQSVWDRKVVTNNKKTYNLGIKGGIGLWQPS